MIAYDFAGKTAPVRIYRAYELSTGKWIYHEDAGSLHTIARLSALEGKRTFEIRMLEIERTLNKDSLMVILMGGTFWKNEWIVAKIHYKPSNARGDKETTWIDRCEGEYKILVPTPEQKREEEEQVRWQAEHEEKLKRARKAKEEAEARTSRKSYGSTENPYFPDDEAFNDFINDTMNMFKNTGRSQHTQNKFERILQITPPYNLEDLNAQYRKRAKETHPDMGGTNEAFIAVTQAYKDIKSVKGW
jgi:hypothetical protein